MFSRKTSKRYQGRSSVKRRRNVFGPPKQRDTQRIHINALSPLCIVNIEANESDEEIGIKEWGQMLVHSPWLVGWAEVWCASMGRFE